MPRPRTLSAEAEKEARRFAEELQVERTYKLGPWGKRPSLRDIARHLVARQLCDDEPAAAVVLRALERGRPS